MVDIKDKPPRYRIKAMLKRYETLRGILWSCVDAKPTDEDIQQLVDELTLEIALADRNNLYASLQPLKTAVNTSEAIDKFAYRLAAYYDIDPYFSNLLPPVINIPKPQWALVEVVKALIGPPIKNRASTFLTFKVLTGLAAGEYFTKQVSAKYLKMMSITAGFTKYGVCKFDGVRHSFFGFRFAVKLVSDGTSFNFDKPHPTSQKGRNNKLVKERMQKCHKGYSHRCSECPEGKDTCYRACRAITMVIKHCPKCDKDDTLFTNDFCHNCHFISIQK